MSLPGPYPLRSFSNQYNRAVYYMKIVYVHCLEYQSLQLRLPSRLLGLGIGSVTTCHPTLYTCILLRCRPGGGREWVGRIRAALRGSETMHWSGSLAQFSRILKQVSDLQEISTFLQKKHTFLVDGSASHPERSAQCFPASFRNLLGFKF